MAALPKAPSRYNPYKYPEVAKFRRNLVLNNLKENGYISNKDYKKFTKEKITLNKRKISFENKEKGKSYSLNEDSTTSLFVRPRGWHLDEKNVTYNIEPVSASLLDFCM